MLAFAADFEASLIASGKSLEKRQYGKADSSRSMVPGANQAFLGDKWRLHSGVPPITLRAMGLTFPTSNLIPEK